MGSGTEYPLELFIQIRITLNQEVTAKKLPRYTNWRSSTVSDADSSPTQNKKSITNGVKTPASRNGVTPHSPAVDDRTHASHDRERDKEKDRDRDRDRAAKDRDTPATQPSPAGISPSAVANTRAIGTRGQSGTVRFMLDAARAREEKDQVDRYFRVEEEEYEVEVEVPNPPARNVSADNRTAGRRERERDGRDRREREKSPPPRRERSPKRERERSPRRERDRDRERERERDSHRERDRYYERERDRDRERERDRERRR